MNRDTRDERIAELEAENAQLREQVELLAAQLQDVQARLAKDSRNSGKPPSSDGLGRKPHKTKSLRTKSGKKPGGQLGHRGETLRLVATPDEVVEHRPTTCAHCATPLQLAPVVLRERRQVQDLPPLRLCVTEHQALHVRCPGCQAVIAGTFPAEAPSRAHYGPRLRALAVYLVEAQFVPFGRTRAAAQRPVRGTAGAWHRGGLGAAGRTHGGTGGSGDCGSTAAGTGAA